MSAVAPSGSQEPPVGERLAGQERRLRLLCAHLAGRAVRARVELDDLVQEVFLRALARPDALPACETGEAPLARFLAQLARHAVIDVARALRTRKRAGREEPLLRSDWSHAPAARAPGPHTAAVAGETSRALARSFLALPAEHRRVLGLRQFEGLTAEETGRRMARSASAVHSLYRRALESWQAAHAENASARDESGPRSRPVPP